MASNECGAGVLKPTCARSNLTVITGSHVSRIRSSNRRAVGIEFVQNGTPSYVSAGREIVLCAGAVGSPHILQLSGIGEPSFLKRHGISVTHALPSVGANLQDHPAVRMMFRVKNTVPSTTSCPAWPENCVWPSSTRFSGEVRSPSGQRWVNAFVKSDPSRAAPDLQYVVYPLNYDTIGEPAHTFSAFTGSICLVRPESRGSIRIKSPDPAAAPEIRLNFLSNPTDIQAAIARIRGMRRVCSAPALRPYDVEEFKPGPPSRRTRRSRPGRETLRPQSSTRPARAEWVSTRTRSWTRS